MKDNMNIYTNTWKTSEYNSDEESNFHGGNKTKAPLSLKVLCVLCIFFLVQTSESLFTSKIFFNTEVKMKSSNWSVNQSCLKV